MARAFVTDQASLPRTRYSNVSIQRKMKEEQLAKLQEEHDEESLELAVLTEDEELPLTLKAGGVLDRPPIQVCARHESLEARDAVGSWEEVASRIAAPEFQGHGIA